MSRRKCALVVISPLRSSYFNPRPPFSTSCALVQSCLATCRHSGVTLGLSPRRSLPTTVLPAAAARPSKARRRPLSPPTPTATRRPHADLGEHAAALSASIPFCSLRISPSPSCLSPYALLSPFVHVRLRCVLCVRVSLGYPDLPRGHCVRPVYSRVHVGVCTLVLVWSSHPIRRFRPPPP